MQEKLEKWLSEVFAMRVILRPMRVEEAVVEDRFDIWKVRGLIVPFVLVTPKPGVANPSVGEIGHLVAHVSHLTFHWAAYGCGTLSAVERKRLLSRQVAFVVAGGRFPPVPWNRPEGGFHRSDAQMAWQRCPRDCFGDTSRTAWSNLRRPGHSTADRLLSGFRISSIPRIDHFRAGRTDHWWLCVRPRRCADTPPAYAALSQFACTGNACRNHTGLKRE